jgi:hypothetical protein
MRIAQLQANGIELGKWDTMKEGTSVYDKMTLVQQERVLEDADGDFKHVINRFEGKGVKNTKGH